MEHARCVAERCSRKEPRGRQQAAFTEQRAELFERNQERDEVDESDSPLENESAEPIVLGPEPVHRRLVKPQEATTPSTRSAST